jgi:hypothetical protein
MPKNTAPISGEKNADYWRKINQYIGFTGLQYQCHRVELKNPVGN